MWPSTSAGSPDPDPDPNPNGSKGPRFDAEPPSAFTLRMVSCVQPEMAEEGYVELPSPLPSPRDD